MSEKDIETIREVLAKRTEPGFDRADAVEALSSLESALKETREERDRLRAALQEISIGGGGAPHYALEGTDVPTFTLADVRREFSQALDYILGVARNALTDAEIKDPA